MTMYTNLKSENLMKVEDEHDCKSQLTETIAKSMLLQRDLPAVSSEREETRCAKTQKQRTKKNKNKNKKQWQDRSRELWSIRPAPRPARGRRSAWAAASGGAAVSAAAAAASPPPAPPRTPSASESPRLCAPPTSTQAAPTMAPPASVPMTRPSTLPAAGCHAGGTTTCPGHADAVAVVAAAVASYRGTASKPHRSCFSPGPSHPRLGACTSGRCACPPTPGRSALESAPATIRPSWWQAARGGLDRAARWPQRSNFNRRCAVDPSGRSACLVGRLSPASREERMHRLIMQPLP